MIKVLNKIVLEYFNDYDYSTRNDLLWLASNNIYLPQSFSDAILFNCPSVVKKLIKSHVDIFHIPCRTYYTMSYNTTNLGLACITGNTEIAKLLIQAGVPLESYTEWDILTRSGGLYDRYHGISHHDSYILTAYKHNNTDMVKFLATFQDYPYRGDEYGKNILMYACERGDFEMVKYLIVNGKMKERRLLDLVDKQSTTSGNTIEHFTALSYARANNHYEIADYIISTQM